MVAHDTTRRQFLSISAAVTTVAIAGCSGGSDDDEAGDEVTATVTVAPDGESRYDPEEVTIQTGEAVEFEWEDDGHNLVFNSTPDGSDVDSLTAPQDEGHTEQIVFETPGEYHYGDQFSPGMEGVVLVE